MTVTVGINGFGRIGRCTLSHISEAARNDVQVVKINATGPLTTNAHLLRYDSVHGRFPGDITVTDGKLDLGRGPIDMMSTYDPNERIRRQSPRSHAHGSNGVQRVMHHQLPRATGQNP